MNKQAFLKKLQHALRLSFTHKEIADILADYESFFVSGVNDGKSEHQIYEELGEPAAIALNLTETLGKKTKRPLSTKMTGRMALTALLLIIGTGFYTITYQSWHIVRDSSLWLVVFVIVLWFALGGTVKDLPLPLPLNSRAHQWKVFVHHGFLLSIVIGIFTLLSRLTGLIGRNHRLLLVNEHGNPFDAYLAKLLEKPDELGPLLAFLLASLTITVILIAIWSIYAFYHRSPQYFTVTCHSIGVIAYVGATMNLLRNVSDLARFKLSILQLFVVYGVAIVLTFAFALWIQMRAGRNNGWTRK